jgi:hypothetical protein
VDGGIPTFQIMRYSFLENLVILRTNFIDKDLFFRISIDETRQNIDLDVEVDVDIDILILRSFECSILIKSLIRKFVLMEKRGSPTVREYFR